MNSGFMEYSAAISTKQVMLLGPTCVSGNEIAFYQKSPAKDNFVGHDASERGITSCCPVLLEAKQFAEK